jgi:hypothetical protein
MFSAESLETIQLHVLWTAVKAIIATHPEPERVRTVFDQLIGQSTANRSSKASRLKRSPWCAI